MFILTLAMYIMVRSKGIVGRILTMGVLYTLTTGLRKETPGVFNLELTTR